MAPSADMRRPTVILMLQSATSVFFPFPWDISSRLVVLGVIGLYIYS